MCTRHGRSGPWPYSLRIAHRCPEPAFCRPWCVVEVRKQLRVVDVEDIRGRPSSGAGPGDLCLKRHSQLLYTSFLVPIPIEEMRPHCSSRDRDASDGRSVSMAPIMMRDVSVRLVPSFDGLLSRPLRRPTFDCRSTRVGNVSRE
jgi:hypothetical protein